jgi:hypothetical protein
LVQIEVDSAKVGELDVITGFMVMDGVIRLLVIEGLVGGESMRTAPSRPAPPRPASPSK